MKTVIEINAEIEKLIGELEDLECIISEAEESGDYDDETDLVEVIYKADDLRLRISALKRYLAKTKALNS